MAIMAAQGQSDARGTAWLLADAALASLNDPASAPSQETELNNVYRLIQAFRNDPFFGMERGYGYADGAGESLSNGVFIDNHTSNVNEAIKRATKVVYDARPLDDVYNSIINVLRCIVISGKDCSAPKEDVTDAVKFFGELRSILA